MLHVSALLRGSRIWSPRLVVPGFINQTCRPQSPGAKYGTRCQITTKVSSDVKLEGEPRGLCKGPQG